MNTSPKVSIIIPCYNMEKYIQETIQSALAQTYPNKEILVMDDRSTDASVPITIATLGRVFMSKDNLGLAATRNRGWKIADGEFILPLDADDKLDPTYLERTVPLMTEGVGVVSTWMEIFDSHTEFCGSPTSTYPIFVPTRASILDGNNLPCCSLIRKSVLEEVGGWPNTPKGSEDWALWAKITCKTNWQVKILPEYLFKYRVRQNSMRSTMQPFEITREEIRSQNA